jgi:hypothetical protein
LLSHKLKIHEYTEAWFSGPVSYAVDLPGDDRGRGVG